MSFVDENPTVREAEQTTETTLYEEGSTIRESRPEPVWHGLRSFRGMPVLEQLPTRGAEADIYLLRDSAGERCILKLYRHRLEPKFEVLERIREVSRAHSDCFVVFRDTGFDETTGRWFELLEYMPLGSLKDVPPERKRDPGFIKSLVVELADAIRCLHENGIIHCDLKPGNVLVRSLDPLDLVLTDFGISSLLAADVSQKMTGLKGTPMYWAPEAFSRMAGRSGDWWGLGMIVLELLAEAHPFSGLTDSQIIHRLTVGNVTIPDALGDDWKLLLKGLLTKDDTKRWGHAEVVRWLSGERNLPVHYETAPPEIPAEEDKNRPLRFEGEDYRTPEALALMLCGKEGPWTDPLRFLRTVRSWFESNMLFDEAVELGNDMDGREPEIALFRFVHKYAKGPFVWLGKVVDANNLQLFLARAARQEASASERRIVGMMGDGSLLKLYDDYVGLTGKDDPLLRRVLVLLDKKSPEEQWLALEALNAPETRLWPEDLSPRGPWNMERAIKALEKLRAAPMKKAEMEDLQARYILPERLLESLASFREYPAALDWLDMQKKRGLLIPKGADPDAAALHLNAYLSRALAVCMGHTPAFIEHRDAAERAFGELPPFEDVRILRGRERLNELKTEKAETRDVLFVVKLSELLKSRYRLWARSRRLCQAGALSGGLLFGSLYPLMGGPAREALVMIGVVAFAVPLFLWGMWEVVPDNKFIHRECIQYNARFIPLIGILVGIGSLMLHIESPFARMFVAVPGAFLGHIACRISGWQALLRNQSRIASLCDRYGTTGKAS